MSKELILDVDMAKILQLEKEGRKIVLDVKAEDSIVKLLDIKKRIDDVVTLLKSEIEKQALRYDPNFTSVKSDKIKINYSASGSRYIADGTCGKHRPSFWSKKITWIPNAKAIDDYRASRYRLPSGVIENSNRRKTIRISEVSNE